jgi:tRNA threonylcarbamoyladenosine biosynthesis protein TsaE
MSTAMEYRLNDEADTTYLGAKLAKHLTSGMTIFLSGQLGAGKTCLTRGILRELGYRGNVKSPTYSLVETYTINNKKISHFDFYRLSASEELFEAGFEEHFSEENICIVEWPEKIATILDTADVLIQFEIEGTSRKVTLESETLKGKKMIEGVSHEI